MELCLVPLELHHWNFITTLLLSLRYFVFDSLFADYLSAVSRHRLIRITIEPPDQSLTIEQHRGIGSVRIRNPDSGSLRIVSCSRANFNIQINVGQCSNKLIRCRVQGEL